MAVIITNRQMPKSCIRCWHNMNCEYWEQTVEGYRNKNCPLKSADDFVSREIVRRIIDSPRSKQQMLDILDSLPKIGE